MTQTDLSSLLVIALVAVAAPILAEVMGRRRPPTVVLEILLGILVGPQLLGLAEPTIVVKDLADFGLTFLMFLAGYELDMQRVKGPPLRLAVTGWVLSLGLAFAIATILVVEGFALDTLLIGLCLATTAIGTLLPILGDAGLGGTRFGTLVVAAGTVGEFGPILAVTLLLSGTVPARSAVLLVAFVVVALAAVALATRPVPRLVSETLARHVDTSSQLPVRVVLVLVILLVWTAGELGLDVLLGAFTAGIVAGLFVKSAGQDQEQIVSRKLAAIGFGFLIPVFFITTGITFDVESLWQDPLILLRALLFLVLLLVVRGVPVLLYRRELRAGERVPFALLSATALPLIVVITTIGLQTGRMKPENATALVAAGMVSVMVYPAGALALLRRRGLVRPVAEGRDPGPEGP